MSTIKEKPRTDVGHRHMAWEAGQGSTPTPVNLPKCSAENWVLWSIWDAGWNQLNHQGKGQLERRPEDIQVSHTYKRVISWSVVFSPLAELQMVWSSNSKFKIYWPDFKFGRNKIFILLTKLSVSGSSQKKGFPSFSCFLTKFSMSTSKLAEVVPSEPCVDCSHFSNNKANNGNSGCLGEKKRKYGCSTFACFGMYVCRHYLTYRLHWDKIHTAYHSSTQSVQSNNF